MDHDRMLRWLLRLVAVAEFSAVLAVFAPVSLMATVSDWLGVGPFPDGALAPYLARHVSALYVVHGGFLWVASCDVRRQSLLIRYIVLQGFIFAAFISILDVLAGFPWYWMMAEGPGLAVVSAVILWLHRNVRIAEAEAAQLEQQAAEPEDYLIEE